MSQQQQKDNLQGQGENILFQKNRLMAISNTLQRMERKCELYLKDFENSSDWKRYKEGFLQHNYMFKPHEVIDFQTCDLADKESSFYLPKKQRIMICSNKIQNQEHFNAILKYQLTIMYDSIRSNIDYQNCKQLTCMHVRALNLSQICKRADKDCYKNHMDNLLYKKPQCEGQERVFGKIFEQCVVDISPYNTMKNTKSFLF